MVFAAYSRAEIRIKAKTFWDLSVVTLCASAISRVRGVFWMRRARQDPMTTKKCVMRMSRYAARGASNG